MAKYTTTDGLELRLRPVPQLLIERVRQAVKGEFKARGESMEPPSYTITLATGDTETHEHDEESIKTGTPEERQAWDACKAARARMEKEMNNRVERLMLLKGTDAGTPPPEWANEMRSFGVMIPDDPTEARLEYLRLEVLRTPEDWQEATLAIMKLSFAGASEEDLAAVEKSFRRTVGESAAKRPAPEAGPVDVQLTPGASPGSAGVGAEAEPVLAQQPSGSGLDDRIL